MAVREYKKAKSLVLPTHVRTSVHFIFEIVVSGYHFTLNICKIEIKDNHADISFGSFCAGYSFEESA